MLSLVRRHPLMKSSARSRRGLTLLEPLLAIAGSVVLIITAIMLYMQAVSGNKLSEAFQQVQSVTAGVRSLYSGVSGYGNDDFTETAVLARLFQNKWLEDETPINPWGGEVTLEGQGRTFTITYTEVPQDACAQLISMNSTGFGGAVRGVSVNGEDVGTQAIDPTVATAACDQANDNEIVWEVR